MKVLNDLLWDGELRIYQDTENFKFSLDSILISNFVTVNKRTKNILDIGTGNAPIPLMLTKRTNAKILGVEIQKSSYSLACESVKYNKLDDQIYIVNSNILDLDLKNNYYDTIISNPPYYKNNMVNSSNTNKKISRSETDLSLNDIFRISKKILKNNGNIAIVLDTKRLVECIELMKSNSIEPKRIQFVYPKKDRNSNIFLIEGTKNGKPGLKILEPIIIQNEENNYTNFIENLLKNFGKY